MAPRAVETTAADTAPGAVTGAVPAQSVLSPLASFVAVRAGAVGADHAAGSEGGRPGGIDPGPSRCSPTNLQPGTHPFDVLAGARAGAAAGGGVRKAPSSRSVAADVWQAGLQAESLSRCVSSLLRKLRSPDVGSRGMSSLLKNVSTLGVDRPQTPSTATSMHDRVAAAPDSAPTAPSREADTNDEPEPFPKSPSSVRGPTGSTSEGVQGSARSVWVLAGLVNGVARDSCEGEASANE
jgi:hypothetical protein